MVPAPKPDVGKSDERMKGLARRESFARPQRVRSGQRVDLLRHHSSLGNGSKRGTGRESGFSKRALELATDYINDNLSGKLMLAEIAGAAHMSLFNFARSFKAVTGLSPHQYIIHRRIERAKAMLSDTDITIAGVAGAVGFSNPSHLAYHVRCQLGVSPGALRRDVSSK